jgi:homoserine kinase
MKIKANVPRGILNIRVPASTSNLGSAFDAVGLALQLYLSVAVRKLEKAPSSIEFQGQGETLVPRDKTNLIWNVMDDIAKRKGQGLPPFSLRIQNEIPIARGLGSSAAACLAGITAANYLCSLNLTDEQLLELATEFEGHPDNVAPALFGGLVASIGGDRILCSRSEFPSGWKVVIVTPDFALETRLARSVLPAEVPHHDAVFNVQRAAFLMAQLVQGRREGVREAMNDQLHQPYRSSLIPGFSEILKIEPCEGLIGIALSGAGSSVVAFADAHEQEIADRICSIFARHGLSADARLLNADTRGLVLEEETV